jgi:fructose-1-phosphate kinase PfkB-like protein
LEVLSGKEVLGMANICEIARSLLVRDGQTAIITLGPKGALFVNDVDSALNYSLFPQIDISPS